MDNALTLMQNPFGNYVIQYVMEHGSRHDANSLAECTFGNIPLLMCQKFSSNVIEKLFAYADEDMCTRKTGKRLLTKFSLCFSSI